MCYTDSHKAREDRYGSTINFLLGETMATGREKDRKTRKKHRKNVARMKALTIARKAKGKKSKKG